MEVFYFRVTWSSHQCFTLSNDILNCCDFLAGIPGDGRCLFRSVAHGACLRAGKPSPSEGLQRELADELRASVSLRLLLHCYYTRSVFTFLL